MEEKVLNPQIDFWDSFPIFKSIEPFKEFFEKNERDHSSKVMWFICLCYHTDSPFFGMKEKDAQASVGKSLLDDEEYYKKNKEGLDYLIHDYCKHIDTPIDRRLRIWKEKMDEKVDFLSKLKYGLETWEIIDNMQIKDEKILDLYDKIMAKREKQKGSQKKGGGELSETDKGII